MLFNEVECGILTYINNEFCKKIEDWRKWALPLAVRMYMPTLKKLFVENIELLSNSGLVCKETQDIKVDELYQYLNQISKNTGNIVCNVPMIGPVTFSTGDVDSLYNILRNQNVSNQAAVNPTANTIV